MALLSSFFFFFFRDYTMYLGTSPRRASPSLRLIYLFNVSTHVGFLKKSDHLWWPRCPKFNQLGDSQTLPKEDQQQYR
jgi:hypothetical protein